MLQGLSELGIKSVDTLILSFPPTPESELTLDKIQILWQVRKLLNHLLKIYNTFLGY